MKKIHRLLTLAALLTIVSCRPQLLIAQIYLQPEENQKPFIGEQESINKLFNLDESIVNYHFTVELPGGNFIIIEWHHLTDWRDKGDLEHIIAIAKNYEASIDDSFKTGTSAKRLSIHVPVDNESITLLCTEHNMTNDVMIIKGDVMIKGSVRTPVKVNMDTIRVLKTLEEKEVHKKSELVQLQYTFLLKDISQIQALDTDKQLIQKIANTFDSVVNKGMHKWKSPDMWEKNMTVNYYPTHEKKQLSLSTNDEDASGRYYKSVELEYGLGVSLFLNKLCPYADGGLSYKWPSPKNHFLFVKASWSVFGYADRQSATSFSTYGQEFINGEFGFLGNRENTTIPFYQLSMGYGHNIKQPVDYTDPAVPVNLNTIFFKWRVSKIFTLSYNFYFDKLNNGQGHEGLQGLTGIVRIL